MAAEERGSEEQRVDSPQAERMLRSSPVAFGDSNELVQVFEDYEPGQVPPEVEEQNGPKIIDLMKNAFYRKKLFFLISWQVCRAY